MKTTRALLALIVLGTIALGACHNTWQGAKVDTRHAVQKTGAGIEKTGEKIEHAGEKK